MKKLMLLAVSSFMVLTGCTSSNPDGVAKGLPMKKSEAIQKVRNFGHDTGYLIDFDFHSGSDEGQIATGMKGDICWTILNEHEGIALKNEENYFHVFIYDEAKYEYQFSYTSDVFDTWYAAGSMLFQCYDMNVTYKKGEEVTILDRVCTNYSFEYELVKGHKYSYVVALDNELGISLNIECKDLQADVKNTISYTATSFKAGEEVQAPVLPNVEEPVIFNDDPDLTKNEIPNKLHIDLRKGEELNGFIEVVDDEMLVDYRWANDIHKQFWITKGNGKVVTKMRDIKEDGAWEEFYTGTAKDSEAFEAALANLAGAADSCFVDMFRMGELEKASRQGNTMVNGMPAIVYKNASGTFYLSAEYKMFLKAEYSANSDWNYEVISYRTISDLVINM